MLFKFICFFLGLSFMNDLIAQPTHYCEEWRQELHRAIEKGHISEIDYRYYKLKSACEISNFEMGMVDEALLMKGYGFFWDKDKNYRITAIPDRNIDFDRYYGTLEFDSLAIDHPLRTKFDDIYAAFQSIDLDIENLPQHPLLIPAFHVVSIYDDYEDIILDIQTLKPLLTYKRKTGSLAYQGNGLFLANEQEKCVVYRIINEKGKPKVRKILEKPGNGFVVPITSDKSYIAIEDFMTEESSSYLYDQNGKLLYDKQQQIEFNPLSRTIILRKNEQYQLVDYDLTVLVDKAKYLYEVWKDDESYYVVDHQDDTRSLIHKNTETILSGTVYKQIFISQSPYALVEKDQQFALIDYLTGEILIPYRNTVIQQLSPGFWTYQEGGNWLIVDDKNRLIAEIAAKEIFTLSNRDKLILKIVDFNGRVGVGNVFGDMILPAIYDAIAYIERDKTLTVTQGQIQFKVDLKGKEIPHD